jgi:hypothetical protein
LKFPQFPILPALILFLAATAHAQQTPGSQPAAPSTRRAIVVSSDAPQRPQAAQPEPSLQATDAERRALVFTRYDLDVRLQPRDHALTVRADFTLRNDGSQALTAIPIQLSSSLAFDSIHIEGRPEPFTQHVVSSDADHTGALDEAVVALAAPLVPGAQLRVEALYSGSIGISYARLTRIGAPSDEASRSDWDRIDAGFSGLRGFGNVVWYPVASVPVRLGQGDQLIAEVGRQKYSQSAAMIHITLTDEAYGTLPNVAILDGVPVPLTTFAGSSDPALPTILHAELRAQPLGFDTPSLLLATRSPQAVPGIDADPRAADSGAAQSYIGAATLVRPLVQRWLGDRAKSSLTLFDLPEPGDDAFEQSSTLATAFQNVDAARLTPILSHSLAHAYFVSPRPWLNEGVAHFMSSLWTESTEGRQAAITQLDNQRPPLAIAEPANPDDPSSPGQSLIAARDAVYYRTKAVYVFWMLHNIVGDGPLTAALHDYEPAADNTQGYFQQLVEKASHQKLDWFFNDWVYRDRGLPDLSIDGVYPSAASQTGSYIVAVVISNSGYASAQVPVTISSETDTLTEQILIPARGKVAHRFLVHGRPSEIQVNDGTTPETEASVHRTTVHFTY